YIAKGEVPLSVAMPSCSTLLAPILTPRELLLFAGEWIRVDAGAMVLSIVQVIIIAIVLGIFVSYFLPEAVEKGTEPQPLASVVAIVAIVAAVVSGNRDTIATTGALLFVAVILHNVFGLLFGYLVGALTGLDVTQRRAISIEVGMQNSGLGASLATTYFSP